MAFRTIILCELDSHPTTTTILDNKGNITLKKGVGQFSH